MMDWTWIRAWVRDEVTEEEARRNLAWAEGKLVQAREQLARQASCFPVDKRWYWIATWPFEEAEQKVRAFEMAARTWRWRLATLGART